MKAIIFSILLVAYVNADALNEDVGTICEVGEGPKSVKGGLCNGNNAAGACDSYCKTTYGAEYLASRCSDAYSNGKKECFCQLKCCNQGCWGDPHCWTCDGAGFSYQGTEKIYLLKACKPFQGVPHFEVRQVNKKFTPDAAVAYVNVSELVIPEWNIKLDVIVPTLPTDDYQVSVNGQAQKLPYTFTKQNDYSQDFVHAVFLSAAQKQLIISTSFGLTIKISVHNGDKETTGDIAGYSEVSIDTPRHPGLKGNICGLLGRWNDDKSDESISANGTNTTLDGNSWDFGNSWIVTDEGDAPCECELRQQKKKYSQVVDNVDPKVKAAAKKLVEGNFDNPDLQKCFKNLQRPAPDTDSVVVDLLHTGTSKDGWDSYLTNLLEKFSITCNDKFNFKDLSDPKCTCS